MWLTGLMGLTNKVPGRDLGDDGLVCTMSTISEAESPSFEAETGRGSSNLRPEEASVSDFSKRRLFGLAGGEVMSVACAGLPSNECLWELTGLARPAGLDLGGLWTISAAL